MSTTQKTYKFKKGEHYHLDQIYNIQGLGGGNWWDHSGDDTKNESGAWGADMGDDIVIMRDIKIVITIITE